MNENPPEGDVRRKRLRVALLGRPNAGKSTLINRIVDANVCGVSCKSHTTLRLMRAAFSRGDTQILFVDTPGLVTRKEMKRFKLDREFAAWRKDVYEEVDLVGVVCDAVGVRYSKRFHDKLDENLTGIPESTPLILILNKMDLIKDTAALEEVVDGRRPSRSSAEASTGNPRRSFSKTFFISALHDVGVGDLLDYLLEQAKPGDWALEPRSLCDTPLHALIANLLRAKVLDRVPEEIPYNCSYEVEYLDENDLGELVGVALITCGKEKYRRMLLDKKKKLMRDLSQELVSDLYKITGKTFRLRIVVGSTRAANQEPSFGKGTGEVWSSADGNPAERRPVSTPPLTVSRRS